MDRSTMSNQVVNSEEEESVLDQTLIPLSSYETKCLVLPPTPALDSDQRPWISEFWQSQYSSCDSKIYKFFIEILNDQKKNVMMQMNQDDQNEESFQSVLLNLSLLQEKLRLSPEKKIWLKVSTLDDYDVLKFIEEFGRFICHLDITRQISEECKFLQLINDHFSQLESLTINHEIFVNDVPAEDNIIPHRSLTELKILRFYSRRENLNISLSFVLHFKLLVQMAPNIKKIYGFPIKFYTTVFKELEALNIKIPSIKIKSIFMSSPPNVIGKEYFEQLENFTRNTASLEELDTTILFEDDEGNPIIKLNIYNKILKCSQNTLKKLTVGPLTKIGFTEMLPSYVDKFIKYPRLDVLQTLHLVIKTKHCGRLPETFFPNEFNFNNIFPNIKALEITYGDGDIKPKNLKNCPNLNYYINVQFPLNIFQTLLTVQRLKLANFIPRELLYHLGTVLFNQITSLTLKSTPLMLDPILPDVFKLCPELQCLRLEIEMKEEESSMANLDAAMTGMSDERCEAMRMKINFGAYMGLKAREMRQVCVRPGIYTLKQLQLVQIVFQGQTIPTEPIFSHLSGVFAFGLMPQCKIIIGFSTTCTPEFIHDIYSTLEPITPYVTIEI